MQRNIKLTGRRDIPLNTFSIEVIKKERTIDVKLSLENKSYFKQFTESGKVLLMLTENKITEHINFGFLNNLDTTKTLSTDFFRAPSCHLRIVSVDENLIGLVLGSSKRWTQDFYEQDSNRSNGHGILLFQPRAIAPRTWKLEIRDDEHPVLYIDEEIPEPTEWARRDPVFRSIVLPTVVERIFHHLLSNDENDDFEWVEEWYQWADVLLPDTPRPKHADRPEIENWVDQLVDSFCRRASLHQQLLICLGEND